MRSKITLAGHPIHPMLIPFPVVLYVATAICFITFQVTGDAFWFKVAYAANLSGIVMAVVAAAVGFTDWYLAIPRHSPAKQTGYIHMSFNVVALLLFAINAWHVSGQWNAQAPVARYAVLLTVLGVISTVAAGFFGWKLVQDHHVGIKLTSEQERIDAVTQRPRESRRPSGGARAGI